MITTFLLNYTFGFLLCPKTNKAPQKMNINSSYTINTINPIIYKNESYTTVQIGNKIFLNREITLDTSIHTDSDYCPNDFDFKIPSKEDYEYVINQLGKNAYSFFTDPNGLNMTNETYYITSTNGVMIYISGETILFTDKAEASLKKVGRCLVDISLKLRLNYPNNEGEININEKTFLTIENKYLNGYLWKIGDDIFTTKSIEYTFKNSGRHPIEFWGNKINDETIYYCDYIFVKKLPVSSSQEFDDSKIKIIETNFKMTYDPLIHFQKANSPVAPRIDGGYYISFSDEEQILHVLSYDKDDKLIKDFKTNEKAYPFDITATDYGFVLYLLDANDSDNHSYLSLYNKKYELINKIQIMNNGGKNSSIDSNITYQVIRYDGNGTPLPQMRFMDRPSGGKLAYSRGTIFLIFGYYNHFNGFIPMVNELHDEGDAVVTFDDGLQDLNFGIEFGTIHSLIQSVNFDEYYFWTASLGDGFPEGINVQYTSKTDFTNEYDPINKKYNQRYVGRPYNMAGYIEGDKKTMQMVN